MPKPKSKSRRKKPPKRVLALPDLKQAKSAVLKQLDLRQWPAHVRSRDRRVRRVVLFGASLALNRTVGCGLRRGEVLALALESFFGILSGAGDYFTHPLEWPGAIGR
jgi:hypothetical protein